MQMKGNGRRQTNKKVIVFVQLCNCPQSIYLTYRLLPLTRICSPFSFHSSLQSVWRLFSFPTLDSQMVGSDLHVFA